MTAASQAATTSPFTAKELASWRQRLVRLRKSILADLASLSSQAYSDETPGTADPAIALQPQEIVLTEIDDAREVLKLIDNAVAKIDGRNRIPFGICERTGAVIEPERLDLMPWTTVSAVGARLLEHDAKTPRN